MFVAKRIPEMYEAAVKKKPKNDELLSHLFMAYVRTEDYKKQQQTALALYKVAPSNPYYSWAVMSIIMQVSDYIAVLVSHGQTAFFPFVLGRGEKGLVTSP